ncbi:hypothetical protein J7W19_12545 [Streptomyces mobaraensis NBRC 13819 = DSM 40847]|uniref:Uncharacterized protein n=1 Tax=Streptomyces mobaraensis TaxID=35621 RepID=A0A5N5W0W6_STRMB|nr:hypothetical protein [Streptomyces mobaraensis]KAB7835171.1 hypothetical protein FRZ00_27855 [Streptomyces mobaraensis]QTT74129.1 hypothetical protein J7W19_12545 [Streptomyces mobaraensis NBRC 13819 = DSM 40847]
MDDVTPLLTAVDTFADRLRALPQSRLSRGAAAEALALARELAARAQRMEEPGETAPREMPDAGMFAVADQVAVAGHDLAEALAACGAPEGAVAEAVELVAGAARRCGLQ